VCFISEPPTNKSPIRTVPFGRELAPVSTVHSDVVFKDKYFEGSFLASRDRFFFPAPTPPGSG
jgi:hypothetical protein